MCDCTVYCLFLLSTALMDDSKQHTPPVMQGENAPGEEIPMLSSFLSNGGGDHLQEGHKCKKELLNKVLPNGIHHNLVENEPLKSNAKEEITLEVGEDETHGKDEEDQESSGKLPAKGGCDVRCLVIGILVLMIMIGGAAVAIFAHRFKSEFLV